ncbi:MAG TPA: aminotransferase class I/II-fold pyridoxal phosphate-dependent enzyme [Burkholderiaceae bacterium]|nr:aminotransferase class I/II-fold pyridoxal phosphate-dependent enzyme [Burkholderiaceae bacterium]
MTDPRPTPHPDTLLLHADDPLHEGASITPPIPWSATFVAEDADDFARMASQPMHPRYYTRYGNPLHARVAAIVAGLEGAETGLVTASGMGAISTLALGLLRQGDRVVAQRNHYMGTTKLLSELLARFGVVAEFVEQTDTGAFERALATPAALVMLETPTNPDCSLTDLAAVCRLARDAGATIAVDNTFATPLNQSPLALGAHLVVHSATKYLGGHHDLTAGVVVGDAATIERLWSTQIVLGATLSPMDAWLLLRGLRTLAVRVERINASALAVARALAAHPAVESVSYPGLESHPQHAVARRQMRGFGGVMGVRLRTGYAGTARFVSGLSLAQHAVSLGGVESLVVHAAAMWAGTLDDARMRASGIEPNLVRLSVGLEHPDDLIADLRRALDAV